MAEESKPFRWVEISSRCARERLTAVSEVLRESGIENEVSFLEVGPDDFNAAAIEAKADFDQIRVGGQLCELAPFLTERAPSIVRSLRSADALVKEDNEWWPRNFLLEGAQRAIAADLENIDFQKSVFILGATPEARAIIAALIRVGFSRFNVSDSDLNRCQEFLAQMRGSFFKVQFQDVERHMITQLPGVHSIAVNTLSHDEDPAIESELIYFNFLRPGGVWMDLPFLPVNSTLENEAISIGALVEPSHRIWAHTERAWIESCFGARGARVELQSLIDKLALLRVTEKPTPT